MVYYLQLDLPPNCCTGDPDRSLTRQEWFGSFFAKHRQGKIEEWMREFYPTAVTVNPSEGRLLEVVGTHAGYCVSQKFKMIVEEAESGIHQFLPVELRYGKDRYPYYIFQVGNSGDCYDLESSSIVWETFKHKGVVLKSWRKNASKPMVFRRDCVGKMHIFQNATGFGMVLISEHLHERFMDAGITGLRFEKQLLV